MEMCPDCFGRNITDGICADCGFNTNEYVWEDYQLPLFTVIGGKYIIGRVIGEGGFGITYTACNKELNAKYAVKEYYPAEISGRGYSSPDGMTIYPFSGHDDEFNKGLERFEREAKQLAQFDGMAGIVNVKDYINENGTGYIFMEFVSGKSLETYLTEHGGKISFNEAAEILKPVISALSQIHSKMMIHRDISPDNIILTENLGPVLIDFGASRQYDTDKSISVILKYGYAPYEQYSRHGDQGPWTDIYALCATFYRMVTGKKPPDSVVRIQESAELTPLSELCGDVPPACESAIMKGLAVKKEDRLQSMDELYNVLYGSGKAGSRKKPIIAAVSVAAVIIAATFSAYKLSDTDAEIADTLPTSEIADIQQTETTQTSFEIVTAAPSFDPYCPTVMYGVPSYEDEAYIRGRFVIDLDNTEKAAADDPSELTYVKHTGVPIMGIDPMAPDEEEDTEEIQSFGVMNLSPVKKEFSDYVYENGFDFEKDKPVYSYVKEDMDGDGENEYYICAAFALRNSETAYLLYYKESDGRIELICCGKLSKNAKNCESVFERDAQIFYRSGEKYLSADISNNSSRYIELCGNSFAMVDKENDAGQ